MKRSLLARLRSNGVQYLLGSLLLLVGVPLYQIIILGPTGFADVSNQSGSERIIAYLAWIHSHNTSFLIYRVILLAAFALLWTLPFSLYRIIVAQEIMGQQERAAEQASTETDQAEEEETSAADAETQAAADSDDSTGMPAFAWRGKGFVVLAAWAGMIGLAIYLLSALADTFYLYVAGSGFTGGDAGAVTTWVGLFTLGTNAVGMGLIGLSTLFFGALICRSGQNLWPTGWVIFGYAALLSGVLVCISAVAVACAPGTAQSTLTTVATLLFALWVCWLGVLLIRLRAEAT